MLARLGGSYRMRGYYEGLPRPADGRGTGRAAAAYLQPSRCGGMGQGRQCIPDFRRVQSGTHIAQLWRGIPLGVQKIKSTSGSTTGSVKARTASCSVSTRRFDAQPVASGVVRAGVLFGGCRPGGQDSRYDAINTVRFGFLRHENGNRKIEKIREQEDGRQEKNVENQRVQGFPRVRATRRTAGRASRCCMW